MTTQEAAQRYRTAVEGQREAKARREEAKAAFSASLTEERAAGKSVQALALEFGYSRQRIYQLLSTKEKER